MLTETTGELIKETYPSQLLSIAINIIVGFVLAILIYPSPYFFAIVLLVPPLLSIRGNISGPFVVRTARDMMIGTFNRKSALENILATESLTVFVSLLIGFFGFLLLGSIVPDHELTLNQYLLIPLLVLILSSCISVPTSMLLNYITFKLGYSPINIVPPIMTSVDDLAIILLLFAVLNLLGLGG